MSNVNDDIYEADNFPFDAPLDWWSSEAQADPPAHVDWAHRAARAIIPTLQRHNALCSTIESKSDEVRANLISEMANVLRQVIKEDRHA